MLLIVEKGISGGICDAINQYVLQIQTANTWNIVIKTKNNQILYTGK